jgi:pimeloyl-ACP methyl ester carboxylesterase
MLEENGTHSTSAGLSRFVLASIATLLALAVVASPASAMHGPRQVVIKRTVMAAPETRAERRAETITTPQLGKITLDKIGIIKVRPKHEAAPNVLVLEPGTSAAAAYFVPFAKSLVAATPGWQVWAVERRENFLENQQELTKYKFGELPAELENPLTKEMEDPSEQFFTYYLGYLGQDLHKATEEVILEYVDTGLLAEEVKQKFGSTIAQEALQQANKELEEGKITASEFSKRIGEDAAAIGQKFGEKLAQQKGEEKLFQLAEETKASHYDPVPDSLVEFAKSWGMGRTVEDLKDVIEQAKGLGGKVVLGGHSLGGSVVTAYATWNFGGHAGAEGLSGLVYDDGGSGPASIKGEAEANAALAKLDQPGETPWLAFGGIPAPDLGLFSITGSTLTTVNPKGPSLLEKFPFLPEDLKGPPQDSPATNEAGFGFSVNFKTSPPSLAAAQIHGGEGIEETAEGDGLHGWNGAKALTPVSRYAEMLSGTGVREASGSEWYFPARLTLDTGAVNNGIATPAQKVLGLETTKGTELPKSLHILAIDSELDKLFGGGGFTVLTEAEALASQNGISSENVKLIDRLNSYSHNDPAGALPEEHEGVEGNIFFKELKPFLEKIAKGEEGA